MSLKGCFGLVIGNDNVGKLIRFGEFVNGSGFSKYSHAFVVVTDEDDPQIVEAELPTARLGRLSEYSGNPDTCVLSSWDLTDAQRDAIAGAALNLVGTPYSVLDYIAIAMYRLHIPVFGWVKKRVEDSGHLICSQLVDLAYHNAGLEVFQDRRWQGLVTPADLEAALRGPVTAK